MKFPIFCRVIFCTALLAPLLTGSIALLISKIKNRRSKGLAAVLFHSISTSRNTHLSHFAPEKFNQFTAFIADKKQATCTLHETSANVVSTPLSNIVITFDDGFESFFSYAFPSLETHAIKATIFPIAGFIGKLSNWDVLPKQPHMTIAQLREVSDHGHEIGSHTMTHANLTFLRNEDVLHELLDSKHLLEDITGKSVTSLSFPFGSWDSRIWDMAQEIGYLHATCYRHHGKIIRGMVPVRGVYSFDTVEDIIEKISLYAGYSNAIARCRIMSHFAKGTPLWNFRKNYSFFP